MKPLRLQILVEEDENSLLGTSSRESVPSPLVENEIKQEYEQFFFRPPGILLTNRDSGIDTDGSTNRSHHDEILQIDLDDEISDDVGQQQIVQYEEFIRKPEPPKAPRSRKGRVFRFTEEMLEGTGSTTIQQPTEVSDQRDAQIEKLKAQLLEVQEQSASQLSSLINQNEILTMQNCNLVKENKDLQEQVKTLNNDLKHTRTEQKFQSQKLKQTQEQAKEQAAELINIWHLTNEMIGDSSEWNNRAFKQISSKLEIVKSRHARGKIQIDNLKSENEQLRSKIGQVTSTKKVAEEESKQLNFTTKSYKNPLRSFDEHPLSFQERKFKTQRLENQLKELRKHSPDVSQNTSMASSILDSSYVDSRTSPLKAQSKIFSRYEARVYGNHRSQSRDKNQARYRDPVLKHRKT